MNIKISPIKCSKCLLFVIISTAALFIVVLSSFLLGGNGKSYTSLAGVIHLNLNSQKPNTANQDAYKSSEENNSFWMFRVNEMLSKTKNNIDGTSHYTAGEELNMYMQDFVVIRNNHNYIPFKTDIPRLHFIDFTNQQDQIIRETILKYHSVFRYDNYNGFNCNDSIHIDTAAAGIAITNQHSYNAFYNQLQKMSSAVSPDVLIHFGDLPEGIMNNEFSTIIQVKKESSIHQSLSIQLLFGGISANGKLNHYVNDTLVPGFGIETPKTRLAYAEPGMVNLSSSELGRIDNIMQYAIDLGAFPGGQVFVAKKGTVVYNKAFGSHDYSNNKPVQTTDLYDVASITKIAATTLASMKMYDQKRLDLSKKLGNYFTDTSLDDRKYLVDTIIKSDTILLTKINPDQQLKLLEHENKKFINDSILIIYSTEYKIQKPQKSIFDLTLHQLMIHETGISPSLPILPYYLYVNSYKEIKNQYPSDQHFASDMSEKNLGSTGADNNNYIDSTLIDTLFLKDHLNSVSKKEAFDFYFSKKREEGNAEWKIADSMYFKSQFKDSLYIAVKNLTVDNDTVFEYSCMNMILMKMVIDSLTQNGFEDYLDDHFYKPLGMNRTMYNPLKKFSREEITPTERDEFWRSQLLHGTVHDPSAALLGGVSGNAGLFSTASDLGILGQMWMNDGMYAGKQFIDSSTVNMFTSKQKENYRGLGFDRPSPQGIHAKDLHYQSFGHLGFTGGAMWVDPENEIVFVFLSNRVYPDASNNLIATEKIRQRVHQVVYDAIEDTNIVAK